MSWLPSLRISRHRSHSDNRVLSIVQSGKTKIRGSLPGISVLFDARNCSERPRNSPPRLAPLSVSRDSCSTLGRGKTQELVMDSRLRSEVHYGVCPDSSGACGRSYLKASSIGDEFTSWFSIKAMPGSGIVSRSQSLEVICRTFLQGHPSPRGFCDICGRPLVFVSVKPAFGECSSCHRPYNEFDLSKNFCTACGEPVTIDELIR